MLIFSKKVHHWIPRVHKYRCTCCSCHIGQGISVDLKMVWSTWDHDITIQQTEKNCDIFMIERRKQNKKKLEKKHRKNYEEKKKLPSGEEKFLHYHKDELEDQGCELSWYITHTKTQEELNWYLCVYGVVSWPYTSISIIRSRGRMFVSITHISWTPAYS